MDQPAEPSREDPFRDVWRMSEVSEPGRRRRTELRIVPGLIAGAVVFVPFGILAGILWASWGSGTAGWVVVLVGLAGAFSMGAFVASDH
jgi:hypothetical protein